MNKPAATLDEMLFQSRLCCSVFMSEQKTRGNESRFPSGFMIIDQKGFLYFKGNGPQVHIVALNLV